MLLGAGHARRIKRSFQKLLLDSKGRCVKMKFVQCPFTLRKRGFMVTLPVYHPQVGLVEKDNIAICSRL
jgi:hypothetical protein